jgi:hypothetical protein
VVTTCPSTNLEKLVKAGTGPALISYDDIQDTSGLDLVDDAAKLALSHWADVNGYVIANDGMARIVIFTRP